jgi:hypothetical protein
MEYIEQGHSVRHFDIHLLEKHPERNEHHDELGAGVDCPSLFKLSCDQCEP